MSAGTRPSEKKVEGGQKQPTVQSLVRHVVGIPSRGLLSPISPLSPIQTFKRCSQSRLRAYRWYDSSGLPVGELLTQREKYLTFCENRDLLRVSDPPQRRRGPEPDTSAEGFFLVSGKRR